VYGVAFSPDGDTIATGGADGKIILWDAGTGEERGRLDGDPYGVYSVAFGPDGRTLSSCGGSWYAKLWDLDRMMLRTECENHDGPVEAAVISPDGRLVATAAWDMAVRLWDAGTGKLVRKLEGHTQPVLALAFSPEGDLLASSSGRWGDQGTSGQGQVRMWNVASGRQVSEFPGHASQVFSVAFSPDGSRLATAGLDGSARIWSAHSPRPERLSGMHGWVNRVSFSPDGGRILVSRGRQNAAVMFDAYSGETLFRFSESGFDERMIEATFSPDGRFFVFTRARSEGVNDLFRMRTNGRRLRRLTNTPNRFEVNADWQPLPKK
jgi:WD40 repeat protein